MCNQIFQLKCFVICEVNVVGKIIDAGMKELHPIQDNHAMQTGTLNIICQFNVIYILDVHLRLLV